MFSGRQPRQGVKFLRHFKDWIRPYLQGVAVGFTESLATLCRWLSAREDEFYCRENYKNYNIQQSWILVIRTEDVISYEEIYFIFFGSPRP
jgi:hypothetical protein